MGQQLIYTGINIRKNQIKTMNKEGKIMGDYGSHGHCHDSGGTDGHHYNDCIFDGTDGGYSSYSKGGGSGTSSGKWWIGYIVALIIGYGINELLDVVIIIELIFWLLVS